MFALTLTAFHPFYHLRSGAASGEDAPVDSYIFVVAKVRGGTPGALPPSAEAWPLAAPGGPWCLVAAPGGGPFGTSGAELVLEDRLFFYCV